MDSIFNKPEIASGHYGVVNVSRNITCPMLLDAYYHGIFPWPDAQCRLVPWCCPPLRAILPIEQLHIPKSLKRLLKKKLFEIKVDSCFDDVIDACAQAHLNNGVWITDNMRTAYKKFHRRGYAHSFEAFDHDGILAGGLYGILIGRVFCGESMFHRQNNASKITFCHMVELLTLFGVKLIDTQTVTNLTKSFGAFEIPRSQYLALLQQLRDDNPTPDLAKQLQKLQQQHE